MHINIKTADRTLRIAAAGVMAVLILTHSVGVIPALAMSVAAPILMATGMFGFCPIYALLGINKEKSNETATK
jgi:amino acid permease